MLNLFEIENVYFDQWINILYFFFFFNEVFLWNIRILYFKNYLEMSTLLE